MNPLLLEDLFFTICDYLDKYEQIQIEQKK